VGTGPAGSRPGRDAIRTLVCSGEASLAPSRRRTAAGHGASHRRNLHGSARHRATRMPPQHRTAQLGACRHHTPRHGPARMAPEHGTERDGTERRAEASLGPGRDGTGRDWTGLDWTGRYSETQRVSHDAARPSRHRTGPRVSAPHGTPIPTQDGTAGLGTTRHTHPDTGRDRRSRHHTAHPPRDGRGGRASAHPARHRRGRRASASRHTQHGVAWHHSQARHGIGVRRSAFGVRRSARHRSPRRINITHQRKNAPSRERRGVLVYPGVSRW